MGGDSIVALGRATGDGRTLFGHNAHWPLRERQWLHRHEGHTYALGEKVQTQLLELPQARQTWTVLGSQSHGLWGYQHGVNEKGVALGVTSLHTRLACDDPVLLGTDLVRLGLERSATACQAIDLLTSLITRHGQRSAGETEAEGTDCALMIADRHEAFVLEAGGRHWVYQEIHDIRAQSDASTIRQDWNRIAPGLSGLVLSRGWWPDDGSKVDFANSLGTNPAGLATAARRWERATNLLREQRGHIDGPFLRRLLSDHYETCPDEVDPVADTGGPVTLCRHAVAAGDVQTASSLVVELGGDEAVPLAWCAFGPPCLSVYFPICLAAELPAGFGWGGAEPVATSVWQRSGRLLADVARSRERWDLAREALVRLQARLDQEAAEFVRAATPLPRAGEQKELRRRAGAFMEHQLELFAEVAEGILSTGKATRGLALAT